MAVAVLDTLAVVETPEGVALRLVPAGMVPRAVAMLADTLVLAVFMFILTMVLSITGGFGRGVLFIGAFFAQWLYPVLLEVLNDGQTFGKRFMSLQVVHDDGTPVRLPASVVRNLLRFIDYLPAGGTVAFFSMLIDERFRRVGDRAAGTMVVYKPRHAAATALGQGNPLPLSVPLHIDEQRLLVAFVERESSLSKDRARELADLLEPLTRARADEGIKALQRLAHGVLGR